VRDYTRLDANGKPKVWRQPTLSDARQLETVDEALEHWSDEEGSA
jgi:hypothetical protein